VYRNPAIFYITTGFFWAFLKKFLEYQKKALTLHPEKNNMNQQFAYFTSFFYFFFYYGRRGAW